MGGIPLIYVQAVLQRQLYLGKVEKRANLSASLHGKRIMGPPTQGKDVLLLIQVIRIRRRDVNPARKKKEVIRYGKRTLTIFGQGDCTGGVKSVQGTPSGTGRGSVIAPIEDYSERSFEL